MMRCALVPLLAVSAAIGCTSAADVGDPDDSDAEGPDLRGSYVVTVDAGDGCDGDQDALAGWAEGALAIDGDSDALSLDFGEGVVLSGSVDAAFALDFSGSTARLAETLDIVGSGVVYTQDDRWVLDAELAVTVSGVDSASCTIDGPFQATQVVE